MIRKKSHLAGTLICATVPVVDPSYPLARPHQCQLIFLTPLHRAFAIVNSTVLVESKSRCSVVAVELWHDETWWESRHAVLHWERKRKILHALHIWQVGHAR